MKRRIISLMVILAYLVCSAGYASGADVPEKTALRVLLIPKFEIGKMAGDYPGEAQLFYERYCADCGEIEITHMPPTAHFHVNPANGVGILVTGAGKTAAGLSLMAVLSSEACDFSDMYIVSVSCAGGSVTKCALGDEKCVL